MRGCWGVAASKWEETFVAPERRQQRKSSRPHTQPYPTGPPHFPVLQACSKQAGGAPDSAMPQGLLRPGSCEGSMVALGRDSPPTPCPPQRPRSLHQQELPGHGEEQGASEPGMLGWSVLTRGPRAEAGGCGILSGMQSPPKHSCSLCINIINNTA